MRHHLRAAFAALILVLVAGCVPQEAPKHPNPIIVREFSFSTASVRLDRSFGFSLYRGEPGVPASQRAEGLGRAVSFNLADALAEQLIAQGYDVIRSDTATVEPGARAIIVSGTFSHINEGQRRRVGGENVSVAVDAQIDYQAGPTAAVQRLTAFQLDSRQVGGMGLTAAARGPDVKAAASRLGDAIARYVGDTARLNKWPPLKR